MDTTSPNRKEPCLQCGQITKRMTRGLCSRHYSQYLTKRGKLDDETAERWDDWLIEHGKLAPNEQGRRLDPDENAAEVLFDQFMAGTEPTEPLMRKSTPVRGRKATPKKKPNTNKKRGSA